MTSTPSAVRQRSRIQWLWKRTLDPNSSPNSNPWCSYSDVETQIIEEAYVNAEPEALLDDYHIVLKAFLQISNNNMANQRPVKRVMNAQEELRIRGERFLANPICPSMPFADIHSDSFVKAVRDRFDFNGRRLTNETERQFLVDKAAEGLIFEGKKAGRQKEAQWLAHKLLDVRDGSKTEVWECCARLYCMESFLYMKLNEWMRLVDEKEQETIWRSKVSTFGPFACLLYMYLPNDGDTDKKKTWHVYRGVQLSDDLIAFYLQWSSQPKKRFLFPAFTSTSRSRAKAEQFGNVLLVIELSDYDSCDVSIYSDFDEEEQLIKPSFSFYIRSCDFDEKTEKWIIHLRSYLCL